MDQEIIVEPKKGDLVHVLWEDSTTTHGWSEEEDVECITCESVGWLITNGPNRIVLAADIAGNGDKEYNRKMVIPKSVIKEIRKL